MINRFIFLVQVVILNKVIVYMNAEMIVYGSLRLFTIPIY